MVRTGTLAAACAGRADEDTFERAIRARPQNGPVAGATV